MRSKGTAQELEARRRLAAAKCGEGWTQVEVAAFLGVHPVTVAKWMARHRRDGDAGLTAKPTPGRPRFLSPAQERQVLRWLDQKPTAHGFRTDLWTSRRVTELIRRKLGVAFHPDYLRAWMRGRGYSPQKPRRRAKQKDQPAIDGWVKNDWPRVEKKPRRPRPTSSRSTKRGCSPTRW
ncbi:IS630 family transposase [Limnoglobus roseus]|uniref:Helix-turn-helix domain-containing protein n=1 Tax=Limnoglobus roseus TaxID=2598579 RepID=A0A5C1A764_9BACT|nr:IS630 family transposase [Limnoglobus roseus]QEL14265.1 helix-turn-helix domain-containing protein [Limnoglobus roseus]QEL15452.1 helix-turn-helix domain-containing protein [Limnoglobus roseus]